MFRIENIEYVYGFLIIPIVIIFYVIMIIRKRKAIKLFGDKELIKQLMPDTSTAKPVVKLILITIAFLFLVTGILNPQIGSKPIEVKREGADIMICLDVSNSMKAEDISPNRLERAKQALEKLVDKLEGDRIGIIVFAGNAYVQLPITVDYAAAKLFLQNIDCDIVPTQGTVISSAIELAIESFGKDEGKNRAIIIITDGEGHEDDAITAAELAAEKNIYVHAIGVGSTDGTPIPIYKNNIVTGYKKDKDGTTVMTKLNENILEEISSAGKGAYIHAGEKNFGLDPILDEINKLEKKQFESKMYTDYDDKFYYFIAIALLFFVIETFISETKSKWLEKLNIYGKEKR